MSRATVFNSAQRLLLWAGLIAIVAAATSARADEQYTFTVTSTGEYEYQYSGLLYTNGADWRVEYDKATGEMLTHNAVIMTARERIAINDSNRTWFVLKPHQPNRFGRSIVDLYRGKTNRVTSRKIESHGEAGFTFRLDVTTVLGEESVKSSLRSEVKMAEGDAQCCLVPLPALVPFGAGLKEVDAAITEQLALRGARFTSVAFTTTRQLEGGTKVTQVVRVVIARGSAVARDMSRFTPPPDYENRDPVYGFGSSVE